MKPKSVEWLIILVLTLISGTLNAQWIPAQGLDGANATDVAVLDSTLFVCAQGVVSRNIAGGPWEQHLQGTTVSRITRCGNALFAWGYVTCYRSLDHGNSWQNMQSLWGVSLVFSLCAIDSTLFFTGLDTVYRSDDYGNTIYPVFSLSTYPYPMVSSCGGTSLFLVQTSPGPGCFYESTDKGMTWDTISYSGLPNNFGYGPMCRLGSNIWLSTPTGNFMRNDSQQQWVLKSQVWFSRMEILDGVLTAGSSQGLFRLDPLLNQWFPENTGLETLDARGLCSDAGVLYLATGVGPFKCTTLYNWQPFYDGLNQSEIGTLAFHGSEVWAVIPQGTFISTDEGANFTKHTMIGMGNPEKLIMTDSVFYAVAADSFYVSNDHGAIWTLSNTGITFPVQWPFLNLTSLVMQGDYLFLGTNLGLYRSLRQNINWAKMNSFNFANPSVTDLFCDQNTLIAVKTVYTNDYHYYSFRSSDFGQTFDSISMPFNSEPIFGGDGAMIYALSHNKLFKSSDEGISWTNIPIGSENIYGFFLPVKEPAVMVGGSKLNGTLTDIYLAVTYDDGVSWTDISGNLPVPSWPVMKQVAVNLQRTFAAPSMNGLWYQDGLLTGISENQSYLSHQQKLIPNPSNGKTTLFFDLPEATTGKITISGMLGRNLYEGKTKSYLKGANREYLDISNLPSGPYLVSLQTPKMKLTSKLLIIK